MKKWYAIVPMLVASVIFAGCSGDTADTEDSGDGTEEAASIEFDGTAAMDGGVNAAAKVSDDGSDDKDSTGVSSPDAEGSDEKSSTVVSSSDAEGSDEKADAGDGHSHGADGDGHSHDTAKVNTLGAMVATLDGSNEIEVGCASCSYGMDGVEGCLLAAVIDDEPFLVTGIEFDTHGNGLCKATSTATIVGKVHANGIEATKVVLTD